MKDNSGLDDQTNINFSSFNNDTCALAMNVNAVTLLSNCY